MKSINDSKRKTYLERIDSDVPRYNTYFQNLRDIQSIRSNCSLHPQLRSLPDSNIKELPLTKKTYHLIPISTKNLIATYYPRYSETNVLPFISTEFKSSHKYFSSKKITEKGNIHKLPKRVMFTAQYGLRQSNETQSTPQQNAKQEVISNTNIDSIKTIHGNATNPEIESSKKHFIACRSNSIRKPQTSGYDGRPESRYNHKSLFSGLENGRSKSSEYNVPILQMNLMTAQSQHALLPSCWK